MDPAYKTEWKVPMPAQQENLSSQYSRVAVYCDKEFHAMNGIARGVGQSEYENAFYLTPNDIIVELCSTNTKVGVVSMTIKLASFKTPLEPLKATLTDIINQK